MAAGITERNQHCWRCATVNAAGDKFCQGCGSSLVQRDNTTRYLCAAAQLSEVYANTAIREFLVEPLRAIPPAPGGPPLFGVALLPPAEQAPAAAANRAGAATGQQRKRTTRPRNPFG